MKITITRYFERTRQIADFVPVKAACEASIEEDSLPAMEKLTDDERKDLICLQRVMSESLDKLVQQEVEKTLMGYVPCCITCGGKAIAPRKTLTKEGICAECHNKQEMEARQFKLDNLRNKKAEENK